MNFYFLPTIKKKFLIPESYSCKKICSISGLNVISLNDFAKIGTISFGLFFVNVSNLVPNPATGITAVSINIQYFQTCYKNEYLHLI